jgi:hypothetical protein
MIYRMLSNLNYDFYSEEKMIAHNNYLMLTLGA